MKLQIVLGVNTFELDGDAQTLASPNVKEALATFFAVQGGNTADAARALHEAAATVNAGASSVDAAGKQLDTIG